MRNCSTSLHSLVMPFRQPSSSSPGGHPLRLRKDERRLPSINALDFPSNSGVMSVAYWRFLGAVPLRSVCRRASRQ